MAIDLCALYSNISQMSALRNHPPLSHASSFRGASPMTEKACKEARHSVQRCVCVPWLGPTLVGFMRECHTKQRMVAINHDQSVVCVVFVLANRPPSFSPIRWTESCFWQVFRHKLDTMIADNFTLCHLTLKTKTN